MDHHGYLPVFAHITEAAAADITVARRLQFAAATVVVFDRGYNDYDWYADLTRQGVFFVTRLKDRADYEVLEDRPLPKNRRVVRDQVIFFHRLAAQDKTCFFRLVEIQDPLSGRLVFLTNHLDFGATTIAAVYKERWQIELLWFLALVVIAVLVLSLPVSPWPVRRTWTTIRRCVNSIGGEYPSGLL